MVMMMMIGDGDNADDNGDHNDDDNVDDDLISGFPTTVLRKRPDFVLTGAPAPGRPKDKEASWKWWILSLKCNSDPLCILGR